MSEEQGTDGRTRLGDGSTDDPDDPTPEAPAGGSPPSFDLDAEDGDSVRERLYSALVETRDPTPANAIAERADCHPDTARTYLAWFAELGIAHRHEGRPTTYERNEAYFEWRYVSDLAAEHTREELRDHVRTLQDRLAAYRERYDADRPGLVDARRVADETTPIDEVWADLADWASLEDELRLHERARQQLADRAATAAGG